MNVPGTRDEGAVSSEYALVAVLVAVAIVGAVTLLGDQVAALFENDQLLGALGGST